MTILAMPIGDSVIEHLAHGKTTATAQKSNDPINMCVGSRLRVRRTALAISRQELSKQLGIDRDHLYTYEAGTRRVGANQLLRIAKVLDLCPDYFFSDYTEEELES